MVQKRAIFGHTRDVDADPDRSRVWSGLTAALRSPSRGPEMVEIAWSASCTCCPDRLYREGVETRETIETRGTSGLRRGHRAGQAATSPACHVASGACAASARHVDRVLARKWRPPFFLLSGAKNVGRHKSLYINGLCLGAPGPSTEKWRFCPSKKRHSQPFFPCPFWAAARLDTRLRTARGAKGRVAWCVSALGIAGPVPGFSSLHCLDPRVWKQ